MSIDHLSGDAVVRTTGTVPDGFLELENDTNSCNVANRAKCWKGKRRVPSGGERSGSAVRMEPLLRRPRTISLRWHLVWSGGSVAAHQLKCVLGRGDSIYPGPVAGWNLLNRRDGKAQCEWVRDQRVQVGGETGQMGRNFVHHVKNEFKNCLCSFGSDSFATPWMVAHQAPLSFLGKNTGVSCHFLHQGIFSTQELNPSLLPVFPELAGRFFTTWYILYIDLNDFTHGD